MALSNTDVHRAFQITHITIDEIVFQIISSLNCKLPIVLHKTCLEMIVVSFLSILHFVMLFKTNGRIWFFEKKKVVL